MFKQLLVAAFLAVLTFVAPATASAAIDIGLVVDGSGSIDSADWQLQREGFSTALRDSANVPLDGSVAITVVQFSSGTVVEVPRTLIDSQEKLDGVVAKIESMEQRQGGTDPDNGIDAGVEALKPFRENTKTVLCLSSDGTGGDLTPSVSAARTAGIERFSVIGIDDYGNTAQLRGYYGPHVYGGGAMTIARNTVEFASLIAGSCFGDAVTLRALEVNQGAQDWHNSKTLLELRETVVRAFVETPAGAPDQRVTGRLTGRRNGAELPGSPLVATNASGSVLARNGIVARRGEIDDSLNFELPLSWTLGGVELEFDAGGAPVDCKEPSDPGTAADDCLVNPPFDEMTRLGVSFFGVEIDGTGPDFDDIAEQTARVRSALPVSALNTSWRTLDYTTRPSIDDLNDDLHRMREVERTSCADDCPAFASDVYYGLLDGPAVGGLNGKANGIPGDAASSFTNNLTQPTSAGYARNTVVHELSHTLGVHHAVDNSLPRTGGFLWWGQNKTGHCGEVASGDAPGHTPFITVDGDTRPGLGPISPDDDEVWGLDYRFARADENGLGLSDPSEVWALMGYCSDGDGQRRWSSAFERDQQIAGIRARASTGGGGGGSWETGEIDSQADVVVPPAGSRGVLISGTISATDKSAVIESALPLPYAGDAAPGAGSYLLRVEDADGVVLASRRFTPSVRFGDGEGDGLSASFSEAIALPGAAVIGKVVVVSDTDGTLVTRTASAGAAPTAGDVAISDSSIEKDPVTLTWKRSAGSTSAIFFSPDDGVSWRPLAFRVVGESFVINPATLAGTRVGRFAVTTTDGLHGAVTQLTGVTVSVSNAAPTIEITSPRADDPSPSGLQPIVFSALAGDRDQELDDEDVVWTSDLDGPLGEGASLTRGADTLREGKHTITATVTDDEGAQATATVEIEVFRVPPPPPSADKTVTASAPSEVVGGDTTAVTVKVSNAGPSSSRALRLTATLPVGAAAGVPDDLQGWTCSTAGRSLVCERPQLLPAETTTLAIPVVVDDVNARTSRTVEVAVDSAVADPLPQDDRASVSFDVTPRPPVTVNPGVSPTPTPTPGGGGASPLTPVTPATKALALRLKQSRAQLLTNKLDVSVVAACGPVACAASATGTISIAGRAWRLKTAKAPVAAGRSVRLRLQSTKALRSAARRAHRRFPKRKLSVLVTVSVRAADGKVASARVRVPIRLLR
jgi:hypothetical protein